MNRLSIEELPLVTMDPEDGDNLQRVLDQILPQEDEE